MSTEKELMWVHALAIVVTAVVSTDGETGGGWDTRGDTEIAPNRLDENRKLRLQLNHYKNVADENEKALRNKVRGRGVVLGR